MWRGIALAAGIIGLVFSAAGAAEAQAACRPKTAPKCLKQARGVETVDVRASGTIDRATALQAFVQTVAPLPGVKVRPGAVGTLRSGSGPIRWLAPYRRTLTPAQRRVYDAIAQGRRAGFAPKRRSRARAAATPSAAIKKEWQKLLEESVPRLEAKFGVTFGAKVTSKVQPHPSAGDDASADATLSKGVCHVNIYPAGWADGLDLTSRRFLAAHEMTHCFQDRIAGKEFEGGDRSWLIEGSAQWAGGVIALEWSKATKISWGAWSRYYNDWLNSAAMPLFEHTYAGVGFFGHLQRSGVDVWARLKVAYVASDDENAYTALVSGADLPFLSTWASGFAREPGWGAAWDTSGPSITSTRGGQPSHGLPNGETAKVDAKPRSAPLHRVTITADVVELAASGGPYGRLRDSSGTEYPLETNAFCAKEGGCACPDGTEGAALGGFPKLASGVARVAVASYVSAASVTLRGRSLDDYCTKPGAKPTGVSDLTASGAVSARGTYAGDCRVGEDFFAIFQMDGPLVTDAAGTYPKPYYLQLNTRYEGPGEYVTIGRGVTSRATAHFTDGMGTGWQTEDVPGSDPTGSFTIDPGGVTGTVQVTMFDNVSGTTVVASGRWRCKT
jgi:hypothetical protein